VGGATLAGPRAAAHADEILVRVLLAALAIGGGKRSRRKLYFGSLRL